MVEDDVAATIFSKEGGDLNVVLAELEVIGNSDSSSGSVRRSEQLSSLGGIFGRNEGGRGHNKALAARWWWDSCDCDSYCYCNEDCTEEELEEVGCD